jgi:hypothetical protein
MTGTTDNRNEAQIIASILDGNTYCLDRATNFNCRPPLNLLESGKISWCGLSHVHCSGKFDVP